MAIAALVILGYLIVKHYKGKDKEKEAIFNWKEKIYIILMTLATVGLMFTSLYMQWTAVYSDTIDGIQGRYFIPLLLVIAMLWMSKKETTSPEEKNGIVTFSVITNVMALIAVFVTFI